MDTRTGLVYASRELALAAGADARNLAPVEIEQKTLRVVDGPFKGRVYEITADGRRGRRRRDLEPR